MKPRIKHFSRHGEFRIWSCSCGAIAVGASPLEAYLEWQQIMQIWNVINR